MCMIATIDAGIKMMMPQMFWSAGLSGCLLLICLYSLHIPYGRIVESLSIPDATTVRVSNQKYRLQICLTEWENTAWGGNDLDVVLNHAKDILELKLLYRPEIRNGVRGINVLSADQSRRF